MPEHQTLQIPDELELLEFFGAEPAEHIPQDGYWCYEVKDERGIKLRFSLNAIEQSIQTELSLGDAVFTTVSHELASGLHLNSNELRATFTAADTKTLLRVRVNPAIQVSWSTLRTR